MLSQNTQKVKFAEVCTYMYLISVKQKIWTLLTLKMKNKQNVPALKKFHNYT